MQCCYIMLRHCIVSISQQFSPWSYCIVSRKKCDITSLLGQMCPPAAMLMVLGELGPIVLSGTWWVICALGLPGMAVSRACLVVVDSAACLYRGCGVVHGEGTRHWWQGRWLWGEGVFCHFGGLAGEGALATVMVTIAFGHVGVVDGTVVPKVRVPLWQDAVGVVAVDMRSRTPVTPMPHL
jgi:hypothetical protein